MRYLDPKADLTFKKVFGEHPDLVKSLLNSLLPFHTEPELIQEIEYLPVEQVPNSPWKKNSIVDVKCKDGNGRIFIVEMQMIWSEEFKQRVLFNASKAYVRQLDKGEHYELLQPVYSLNLVNAIFEPDLPECIHNYNMVCEAHTDRVIEGLHLTFIELPKFKPQNFAEKKMTVLWLRFLTEINEHTVNAPEELMENPDTKKALELVEQSAYTPAQMEGYDQFWDAVSTERTLVSGALRKGQNIGFKKGKEEGITEGIQKGIAEGIAKTARKMKEAGMPVAQIATFTGLSEEEINNL